MTVLPTVRRQLLDAVDRRAQPSAYAGRRPRLRLRRTHRPTLAHAATATLIAVPVLIAAAALLLLGARHGPPPAHASAGVQAERAQLIDNFGLLRRAQTPADRDSRLELPIRLGVAARLRQHPTPSVERFARRFPKLDRGLVRVVTVPRFGAKVALEPMTWQPSPSSPSRSEGVYLVLWIGSATTIPPSSEDGTGPTSVRTLLAHGVALSDTTANDHVIDGVMVVPDKVAKVVIRPVRVVGPPVNVAPSEFGTATATVHDNVAAYLLRLPTVSRPRAVTGLFGTELVAQATWLGANGKVIKRTDVEIDSFIRVEPQAPDGEDSSR
jgi:hypothetical protein